MFFGPKPTSARAFAETARGKLFGGGDRGADCGGRQA